MAESTAAKGQKRTARLAGDAPPPRTPNEARTRHKRIRRAIEGYDVAQAVVRGETLAAIAKKTGLSRDALQARVLEFKRLDPAAFRQMADTMRTFIANLSVDDILHWRPIGRDAYDTEVQKIGNAAYKDAKDTLIRLFGLQTTTVDITANQRQTPLSMEEIADHCRGNEEMAAVVRQVAKMIEEKPAG